MKNKILLFIALFISSICYSQSMQMNSILGIEFGSSKQEVKSKLLEKQPQAKIYNETANTISYEAIKFGAYTPLLVIFQFTDDNQLHTGQVHINISDCKEIFHLYDEVVEVINQKYYTTTESLEDYKYPYSKSDKYKFTSTIVKGNYFTMMSIWKFETGTEKNNFISVDVTDNCTVKVAYQNGLLVKQQVEKNNKKNSQDY